MTLMRFLNNIMFAAWPRRRTARAQKQAPPTSATTKGDNGGGSLSPIAEGGPSSSKASTGPSRANKSFVSLSAWLMRLVWPISSSSSSSASSPSPQPQLLQPSSSSREAQSVQPTPTTPERTRERVSASPAPPPRGISAPLLLPLAATPSSPTEPKQLRPRSPASRLEDPTMAAERTVQQVLTQLKSNPSLQYAEAASLLSKAKLALLQLKALTPTPTTPANLLLLARDVYELGALASIRNRNPEAFTRYVAQLQPFYELPSTTLRPNAEARNKVTGLYLLLLLTQGRYAEFHSELECLSTREGTDGIEADRFLGYPIKLERWLMEGSYDRVWKAMKKGEVPSEEYSVFSEILTSQIRSEIASSSERAYPSLPLSSTKSLLFLDSEGAVVEFAQQRGWVIRDGQIYFPTSEGEDGEEKDISQMVIENTLGYARELETIV
ncbi:SAC3/GANP/Nin1/mts3/eIF-3 p25 family-domain-containing protein [Xylariales sp. PMI_506]|nr:SAC3/GANP/Nin1/mts3/eIF-3 p25 family-domain-containing protein [Xylariales sp. PMI_506]